MTKEQIIEMARECFIQIGDKCKCPEGFTIISGGADPDDIIRFAERIQIEAYERAAHELMEAGFDAVLLGEYRGTANPWHLAADKIRALKPKQEAE